MTKILLVEDDKSLREIYGVRLLAEGYDIVSAGDGEEALAMAIKDRPALIVSDVMMPKISGFDMLDILRSTTETKDIKVIMMTALSSEDQRKRGESLGADRYLVKSQVGIEDVVRAVHEVLGDAPGATPAAAQPAPAAPSVTPGVSAPSPAPVASTQPSFRSGPQGAPGIAVPSRDTAPAPAPVAAPAPQPVAPTPPAPVAPAPEPVSMPQPTAPFSTPRPAGLGDRIIQPISNPSDDSADDVADRMAQELSALSDNAPAPQPVAAAPAPAPVAAPVPQPVAPTPPAPVAPAPEPVSAAAPPEPPHLDFEETPRTTPTPPPVV